MVRPKICYYCYYSADVSVSKLLTMHRLVRPYGPGQVGPCAQGCLEVGSDNRGFKPETSWLGVKRLNPYLARSDDPFCPHVSVLSSPDLLFTLRNQSQRIRGILITEDHHHGHNSKAKYGFDLHEVTQEDTLFSSPIA